MKGFQSFGIESINGGSVYAFWSQHYWPAMVDYNASPEANDDERNSKKLRISPLANLML